MFPTCQEELKMKKARLCWLLLLIVCFFWCVGCEQEANFCEPGATQACYGTDGTVGVQTCLPDGSGWDSCNCTTYSIWCDDTTALCWQDPQKDAYDYDDTGVIYEDAVRYCEELAIGGYDDWRLPDIDELRTLVRGNPPSETSGDCPLVDGSPMEDMQDDACAPVEEFGGPGSGGCYWPEELSGTCDKPDPAAAGHPLEYIASTVASDNEHWVGTILFDNGGVCFNHIHTYAEVRCVRDAPSPAVTCAEGDQEPCTPGETRQCAGPDGKTGAQVCSDDGSCWGPCESTSFEPSPPITDVCDQCDQINLTIKVPEKLEHRPKVLMAFLYAADTWTFPPNRPPDGGTDYNQVIDPEIDADKPFEMTVPGCTYYRENCLTGDYYLYVILLQDDAMPPTMMEGDYHWGMEQEPITLGTAPVDVMDMEVVLVPYGSE